MTILTSVICNLQSAIARLRSRFSVPRSAFVRPRPIFNLQSSIFNPLGLAALLGVLVLLIGGRCGRVRTKEPLIDGFLFKEAFVGYPVGYDRWIEVWDNDGLPQIPTATYNGQQLEMISWNPNHTIYEDTLPFRTDTTCDLVVDHYWGTAQARVNLPGDFRVLHPDSSYVYHRDSALAVTWQQSRGASGYDLFVWMGCFYLAPADTFGHDTLFFQTAVEGTLGDTTHVFDPGSFLPASVGRIIYGEGQVVVQSYDGPQTVEGASSNVTGHGYGIVSAANQAYETYFLLGTGPALPLQRPNLSARGKAEFVSRLRHAVGIPDTTIQPRQRRP